MKNLINTLCFFLINERSGPVNLTPEDAYSVQRAEYQDALEQKRITQLRTLNPLCQAYGFPLHIENTYRDIASFRRVF